MVLSLVSPAPTEQLSATSPLSGQEENVPAASITRNAMGRTLFPGTRVLHVQRPLAGNATGSATKVVTAVLLLEEWGIALLWISLMLAQVKVLTITARRMCRLMRDVVHLGRTSWILTSVRTRL